MTSDACPICTAALASALRELATAARGALGQPSAKRIERLNAAHSDLSATLHGAWVCPQCASCRASQSLPLFPELGH